MLPAQNRLRRSADFSDAVRCGARARRGALVLHLCRVRTLDEPSTETARTVATSSAATRSGPTGSAQVGLIVGKSIGNSVVRHQVSRRLRAQLAQRLDRLPAGSHAVVRALPEAAHASSEQLGADLDSALKKVLR